MKNPYIRTFWYDKVNRSGFFMLDQRIPQVFTLTRFYVDPFWLTSWLTSTA